MGTSVLAVGDRLRGFACDCGGCWVVEEVVSIPDYPRWRAYIVRCDRCLSRASISLRDAPAWWVPVARWIRVVRR